MYRPDSPKMVTKSGDCQGGAVLLPDFKQKAEWLLNVVGSTF